MVMPRKTERNNLLVSKRDKDRKKWTYARLGKLFNISKIYAREIYLRDLRERKG